MQSRLYQLSALWYHSVRKTWKSKITTTMLKNALQPAIKPHSHLAPHLVSSTLPFISATPTLSSLEQYGLTSPTGTTLRIAITWLVMSSGASSVFSSVFSHLVEPVQLLILLASLKPPEVLYSVSSREELRSIRTTLCRNHTLFMARSSLRMSHSITLLAQSHPSWLSSVTSLKLARRLLSLVRQARARVRPFSLLSDSMIHKSEKF